MNGYFKRPTAVHQIGDIHVEVASDTKRKFDGIKWRIVCSAKNCKKIAQRQGLCIQHFRHKIQQSLSQNIKSPEVSSGGRFFKTEYDSNHSISSDQKDLRTNDLHNHSKPFFNYKIDDESI